MSRGIALRSRPVPSGGFQSGARIAGSSSALLNARDGYFFVAFGIDVIEFGAGGKVLHRAARVDCLGGDRMSASAGLAAPAKCATLQMEGGH